MPKRPIEIVRVVQNLIQHGFAEDILFDPPRVERYYTDNFVQRTLAHLVAKASSGSVILKCNSAGELVVATTGAAYEDNDTKAGNAPDTYTTILTFDKIVSRVDIWVYNNIMNFIRSPDGVRWGDDIEIPADSSYSFDASTHSIKIKNETAGDVARYIVVGWY